jgi:N-acetylneuraminic acid mutarotase
MKHKVLKQFSNSHSIIMLKNITSITLIFLFAYIAQVKAQPICPNGVFTPLANAPAAGGFRTVIYGSDVYCIGNQIMTQSFRYSATTNAWATIASMPTPRGDFGAAEVNGIIYCLGGYTGSWSNKNEAYNIATGSWSTKANLPTAISGCYAVSLNNKIYVIGGTPGNTNTFFYEYNPQTNSYTARANPSMPRMHTNLIAFNNRIYLIGGYLYNGNYQNTNLFEEYNPSTNTWTMRPALPVNMFNGAATIYDNKLYFFGGTQTAPSWTPLNSFYVFDFGTNAWNTMPNMPFSRAAMQAQTINNEIYLFGGHINSSTTTNLCYRYTCNPCSDTTVNQTQTIMVSDPSFQAISPRIYLEQIDSLTTLIGGCDSVVHRYLQYVFAANYCTDTIITNIAVTDTLIISSLLTGAGQPNTINTIKAFPNPANTHLTIDYGNYALLADYTMRIENSLGQVVYSTSINQPTATLDLSTWTGNGLYFLQLVSPQNMVVENRKIVIQ